MSDRNQRRDERFQFRVPVKLKRGKEVFLLLTEDVSFRGIFIRTDQPPVPLRSLVRATLTVPPDELEVEATGMAVHVVPGGDPAGRRPGVGVQFYGLDGDMRARWETFIRWVRETHPGSIDHPVLHAPPSAPDPVKRRHPRYPARVKVELHTVDELLTLYTRDVSKGGMFVSTIAPLELGREVRVEVVHPRTAAVFPLDAVVRRRAEPPAEPGVGLELVGLDDAGREAFFDFISSDIPIDLDEDVELVPDGDPELA